MSQPRAADRAAAADRTAAAPLRPAGHAVPAGRSADRSAEREGFRPDLEGLRAVAVGLVLLFHAGVPGVAGGYVGVDVFFVLSGFLITGLIVRELEQTGTVSLIAFYARRARRLLPAAVVALVATVVLSAMFLPPLRVPDVAGDGAAAALYVSNMRFALQATDYLQSTDAPSPLLHFWSLGVEEQFYLFWPALLLIISRGRRFTLRRLAAVVGIVFGVSLVLSLVLTSVAQPWAFFTLPARAWELALGAALALAARRGLALPRALAGPVGILGIAGIVASGLLFDTTTPFPGTAALLPTLGAALVIAAGFRGPAGRVARPDAAPERTRTPGPRAPAPVQAPADRLPLHGRLLSLPPMRWLGRISYSLYLWHWPILLIPAAAREAELSLRTRLVLAGVSIVVAAVSQRFIEEPIRRGRFVGFRPRRVLAFAGAATMVAAGISLSLTPGGILAGQSTLAGSGTADASTIAGDIAQAIGSPRTEPGASGVVGPSIAPSPTIKGPLPVPPDLTPSLAHARDDLPPIYSDGCHLSYSEVTPPGPCVFGDKTSSTTVVLLGDSHAAQWFPALSRAATEHHWRLLSFTKSACAPADIAIWDPSLDREYTECAAWRTGIIKRIAGEHPAIVVVAMSRGYTLAIDGRSAPLAPNRGLVQAALTRTLRSLSAISPEVALIAETPHERLDPPVCLSAHLDDSLACATPAAKAIDPGFMAIERAAASAAGVPLVDPNGWLCPSGLCPVVIGHVLVYRDNHHMTETFAAALSDYLVAALPSFGP